MIQCLSLYRSGSRANVYIYVINSLQSMKTRKSNCLLKYIIYRNEIVFVSYIQVRNRTNIAKFIRAMKSLSFFIDARSRSDVNLATVVVLNDTKLVKLIGFLMM